MHSTGEHLRCDLRVVGFSNGCDLELRIRVPKLIHPFLYFRGNMAIKIDWKDIKSSHLAFLQRPPSRSSSLFVHMQILPFFEADSGPVKFQAKCFLVKAPTFHADCCFLV